MITASAYLIWVMLIDYERDLIRRLSFAHSHTFWWLRAALCGTVRQAVALGGNGSEVVVVELVEPKATGEAGGNVGIALVFKSSVSSPQ